MSWTLSAGCVYEQGLGQRLCRHNSHSETDPIPRCTSFYNRYQYCTRSLTINPNITYTEHLIICKSLCTVIKNFKDSVFTLSKVSQTSCFLSTLYSHVYLYTMHIPWRGANYETLNLNTSSWADTICYLVATRKLFERWQKRNSWKVRGATLQTWTPSSNSSSILIWQQEYCIYNIL